MKAGIYTKQGQLKSLECDCGCGLKVDLTKTVIIPRDHCIDLNNIKLTLKTPSTVK